MAITARMYDPSPGYGAPRLGALQEYNQAKNLENRMQEQAAQRETQLGYESVRMAQTASATAKWQLQQQQEAWELQKAGAKQAGELAGKFLQLWTGAMGDVQGMYKQAFSSLEGIAGQIAGGGADTGLGGIADMIMQEYDRYRTEMAPAEQEFIEGARGEAVARRGMTDRLMELGTADYEGEMGAAVTDVRKQSEIARQAEARRLLGMGIDPSSGRFGALTRKSAIDEARNTAIAMNVARRGEKERVGQLALQGLQVLDPTKMGQLAIESRRTGTELLGRTADIAKAEADIQVARTNALSNLAGTTGSLASGYSTAITQPLGEMAGFYMGQAGANLPASAIPSPSTGTVKRSLGTTSGQGGRMFSM